MRLTSYYKAYKLLGNGKISYYGLLLMRALGMRHLVVKMDPNWICNLKCKMCYFSSEGYSRHIIKPMSVELFSRIASEVFPKTRILFLGCSAEPLMSPEFERYADIVRSYSIPFVCLVTNGQLLSENVCESIIRNGFHQIIISVDGASKDTYESIRIGGSFEKLVKNLEVLRDAKIRGGSSLPDTRFNFTAMKRNIDELQQLVELASDVGVTTVRIRYLFDWGGVIDYKNEILDREVYLAKVQGVMEYARGKNITILYDGCYNSSDQKSGKAGSEGYRPLECLLPWYSMFIRGDGKMRLCSWLPFEYGDFTVQTLAEIERSEKMRGMRRLMKERPAESCITVCRRNFGGL